MIENVTAEQIANTIVTIGGGMTAIMLMYFGLNTWLSWKKYVNELETRHQLDRIKEELKDLREATQHDGLQRRYRNRRT